MKLPSIHPNGTSPERLFETYKAAHVAAENAIQALREVEFHARDYYPQGPEAFEEPLPRFRRASRRCLLRIRFPQMTSDALLAVIRWLAGLGERPPRKRQKRKRRR
jgi:hypothetical protein